MMVTSGCVRSIVSRNFAASYRRSIVNAMLSTVLGGEVESIALTMDLRYDAAKLRLTIERTQPDVTIICSPNNPTGCLLDDQDLAGLLQAANGIVVVDEAYHEFAEHSVVPLLAEHENLVVLRTF